MDVGKGHGEKNVVGLLEPFGVLLAVNTAVSENGPQWTKKENRIIFKIKQKLNYYYMQ